MECRNCGAVARAEDLERRACRYCDAVLVSPPEPPAVANAFAGFGDLLADRDGDGMPDVVQQALAQGTVQVTTHVVTSGSLPGQDLFADRDGDGMPDVVQEALAQGTARVTRQVVRETKVSHVQVTEQRTPRKPR